MPENHPPEALKAEEVAGLLRIPLDSVYRLAKQGVIPSVQVGRRRRFFVDQLETWRSAGGTAA